MTAIQALKELAYKITGKTPKSNTENGVITELAEDYTDNSKVVVLEGNFNPAKSSVVVNKSFNYIYKLVREDKKIVYIQTSGGNFLIDYIYNGYPLDVQAIDIGVAYGSGDSFLLRATYIVYKSSNFGSVTFDYHNNYISFNS